MLVMQSPMPFADSGQSLDWRTALALNTPTQEGKRIRGHLSHRGLLDKIAPLWQYPADGRMYAGGEVPELHPSTSGRSLSPRLARSSSSIGNPVRSLS